MEFALVENVDEERHGVAAAGEARGDDDVPNHPDAPGVAVADVGDCAEPLGEAPDQEKDGDSGEHAQDRGEHADELAADGRARPCARLVCGASRHDVLAAAIGRRDETGERDRGRDEAAIEPVLQCLRNRRVGQLGQAGRHAELREGHAGQIAHLRSAQHLLAVDLGRVFGGGALMSVAGVDRAPREHVLFASRHRLAALDFARQRLVAAEQRRAGRADFGAGRDIALRELLLAELAFRRSAASACRTGTAGRGKDRRPRNSGSRCRRRRCRRRRQWRGPSSSR